MKKSNKELLYCRMILTIAMSAFVLTGCAKTTITPNQDAFVLELGSELSENVTDYVTVTPEKSLEKVTLDLSNVNPDAVGTYEGKAVFHDETTPFTIKVQDTTAPKLFLAKEKFASEADLTIPKEELYEKLGITAEDLSEVTTAVSVVSGEAEVNEDGSLYLKAAGKIVCEVTAADAYDNVSTAAFTIVATEPTYPEFPEMLSMGFYMTLNDEDDLAELVTASDKKDGNLTVTLDESNLDRTVEGEYTIVAKAVDSDGREVSLDIPVKVLDMSYIDTEDKAMFFAILVDTDDMEEIKDSLWSKELAKKYGVPKEYVKGYKPPKTQTPAPAEQNPTPRPPQETQPAPEEGYRDDLAQQMFAKINEYRVQNGLAELVWEGTLGEATKTRAIEIVGTWGHKRPDGSDFWSVSDLAFGENIVKGSTQGNAVDGCFNAWINSQGHRENILDSTYATTGIGCYYSGGTYFFVQLFGR